MTVTEIIDVLMNYTENVSPTDADYTNRRARLLQQLQEVHDDVWLAREWEFSYVNGTTLLVAGIADLPTDFLELGSQGGIYIPASRYELFETFYKDIQEERELVQGSGLATHFAIMANQIITNSISAADDLSVWHRVTPATLTEGGDVVIPAAYHNSVLVPGVISRSRQSKGDARDWESRYQKGLARMIATQKSFKSATQRLPMQVRNW